MKKKDKLNLNEQPNIIDNQDPSLASSVIVTALDPVYVGGFPSYGFVVTLDGTDYSFRNNTQGYLQLNSSGIFTNSFTLGG